MQGMRNEHFWRECPLPFLARVSTRDKFENKFKVEHFYHHRTKTLSFAKKLSDCDTYFWRECSLMTILIEIH